MSSPSISTIVKQELSVLKEKYLFSTDDTLQDPVFQGVVRNFNAFNECIEQLFGKINKLTVSLEAVATELSSVSTGVLDQYKKAVPEDHLIVSDCYKFREASNQIGREDAPHSSLAKYKRDLAYNVIGPLKNHLMNCRQIKNIIDLRNRKMMEVSAAVKRGELPETINHLREEFDQVDTHLFDWFMILEEYRGDILDSLLQTLKYLEYEFFASAAHAVAAVLPARMEFRPMVEMTPKQLELQLGIEKKAATELGEGGSAPQVETAEGYVGSGMRGISDYSKRLIEKMESPTSASSSVPVDILSLSSLLAQGFDEGPARKALRECNNDTQAALDMLLNNTGVQSPDRSGSPDGIGQGLVRMPTTLKRIQRIKELKQKLQDRKDTKTKDVVVTEPPHVVKGENLLNIDEPVDFTSSDYRKPALPAIDDLLFS